MTRINRFFLLIFFCCLSNISSGQTIKGYTSDQLTELQTKVEDQVRFLEFLLNTLGSDETSARDKDVIIRESYLKIFQDGKVQVEDDLLLDRKVVTNKDITAYLKDIEFFYKNVEFKFKIRDIKPSQKENGEVFFLASLDRTLSALGLKGEKISNTKLRFIEVNLDEKSQELKIASIYTTKVSRDEELKAWWSALDTGWKSYFKTRFQLAASDSVDVPQLYKFVTVDSLNITGNRQIRQLKPLSELRDLKYLDISNTSITDLSPISNITFLEDLNLANTPTSAIQFIKYADRLQRLNVSNTQIDDISELLNLKNLQILKAENAPIQSFAVLNQFNNLRELYLAESGFNNMENIKDLVNLEVLSLKKNYILNFSFLAQLKQLRELDLSETNCDDLSSLSFLSELVFLDITSSKVSDLSPVSGLGKLKKIQADQTNLTALDAISFIQSHPNILLIHHVEDLQSWWASLTDSWKNALRKINPLLQGDQPEIEQLTSTLTRTSLNLDSTGIESLVPLVRFVSLTSLSISHNPLVSDLIPLQEIKTLKRLTGKNTAVQEISSLKENTLLEQIDVEGSPILSIKELSGLSTLSYLNVNASQVDEAEIPDFLQKRPEVLLIYRADLLEKWWVDLEDDWKKFFQEKLQSFDQPSTKELHQLTSVAKINLEKVPFTSLEPLTIFSNLRNLVVFDAPTLNLSPLSKLTKLTSLKLSQLPAIDYQAISGLIDLENLDLSNTGIEELVALSRLTNLKKLNLSGTNIKSLKGIELLTQLEDLDVASTDLRSLRALEGMVNLKKLTCFNTRLTQRAVDSFKENFPKCEVRFY